MLTLGTSLELVWFPAFTKRHNLFPTTVHTQFLLILKPDRHAKVKTQKQCYSQNYNTEITPLIHSY